MNFKRSQLIKIQIINLLITIIDLTYDKLEWGIERFIFDNPITANQLCFSNELNIFWADERIPISEDWLFMRNLALRTPILKTSAKTINLRDHDNRTIKFDSNEGLERFVHYNIYAAKKKSLETM